MVIDAFFMRTADNPVRHHDGLGSGRVDERKHLFCYTGIIADICPLGEPAPKIYGLGKMPTVCVSASGRDPTHKLIQNADSACLISLRAGSQPAPIGTPPAMILNVKSSR